MSAASLAVALALALALASEQVFSLASLLSCLCFDNVHCTSMVLTTDTLTATLGNGDRTRQMVSQPVCTKSGLLATMLLFVLFELARGGKCSDKHCVKYVAPHHVRERERKNVVF